MKNYVTGLAIGFAMGAVLTFSLIRASEEDRSNRQSKLEQQAIQNKHAVSVTAK